MRRKVISLVVILCVGLFLGAMYASPYWAVKQARSAVQAKDNAALSAYIDYPRLQENVKTQLSAILQAEIDKQAKPDSTFAGFAALLAGSMVDTLTKIMISPAGMQALFEGEAIDVDHTRIDNSNTAGAVPSDQNKKYQLHYSGINQFDIDVPYEKGGNIVFNLERQGLFQWKLVSIQLPEKL